MARRPSAVAFDVVETLMPLEPLEPLAARFEWAGLPRSALREWFTRLLRYGMGLSVARLGGAGARMCCLTNGSADTTAAFLARTGLERYVDRVISVADVGSRAGMAGMAAR